MPLSPTTFFIKPSSTAISLHQIYLLLQLKQMSFNDLWSTIRFLLEWKQSLPIQLESKDWRSNGRNPLYIDVKNPKKTRLSNIAVLFMGKRRSTFFRTHKHTHIRQTFKIANVNFILNAHPNPFWRVSFLQSLKQIHLLGFSQWSQYTKPKITYRDLSTNNWSNTFKRVVTNFLSLRDRKVQTSDYSAKLFLFQNYINLNCPQVVLPMVRFSTKPYDYLDLKLQPNDQPYLFLNERSRFKYLSLNNSRTLWPLFKTFSAKRSRLSKLVQSDLYTIKTHPTLNINTLYQKNPHNTVHQKIKYKYLKSTLMNSAHLKLPWTKTLRPLLQELRFKQKRGHVLFNRENVLNSSNALTVNPRLNVLPSLSSLSESFNYSNPLLNNFNNHKPAKNIKKLPCTATSTFYYELNRNLKRVKLFQFKTWRLLPNFNNNFFKKNIITSQTNTRFRFQSRFHPNSKFKPRTLNSYLYTIQAKRTLGKYSLKSLRQNPKRFFWSVFSRWTLPRHLRFKSKQKIYFLDPNKRKSSIYRRKIERTKCKFDVNYSHLFLFNEILRYRPRILYQSSATKIYNRQKLSSLRLLSKTFTQINKSGFVNLHLKGTTELQTLSKWSNYLSKLQPQHLVKLSNPLLNKNLLHPKALLFAERKKVSWFTKLDRIITGTTQLSSVRMTNYFKLYRQFTRCSLPTKLQTNLRTAPLNQARNALVSRTSINFDLANAAIKLSLERYFGSKALITGSRLYHNSRVFRNCFLTDKLGYKETKNITLPKLRPCSLSTTIHLFKKQNNQNLVITPKYSAYFISSPFSFLQLISLSMTKTTDIVYAVSGVLSTYKSVLFPDGNVVKAGIFKRLNTQKLLFQARQHLHDLHIKSEIGYNPKPISLHNSIDYLNVAKANHTLPNLYYTGPSSNLPILSLPEKLLKAHFRLVSHRKVSVKVPRIRFKPGYGRIWRTARRAVQEFLGVSIRYQYRLTPKIQNIYMAARNSSPANLSFNVGTALLSAKLAPDNWFLTELLNSKTLFLNGINCLSSSTRLFVNDFIQLIVNIKFYITLKWVRGWSVLKRNRANKIFYRKVRPFTRNKTPKLSRNLPLWFFDLQYSYSDVPKYFELDYFTLSIFVLLNPITVERWAPARTSSFDWNILNMYNWKYIT